MPFGAALNFQAVHACLADQIQKRGRAHVVCIQDVAAFRRFADLHPLAGTGSSAMWYFQRQGWAHWPRFPSARSDTGSAGSVPKRSCTWHRAQRPRFPVPAASCLDAATSRRLSSRGARTTRLAPHAVGRCGSAVVGNAHLGGKSEWASWRQFLRHRQHAQIATISGASTPGLLGGVRLLGRRSHLLIGGQGVFGGQITPCGRAGMEAKHTALLQLPG